MSAIPSNLTGSKKTSGPGSPRPSLKHREFTVYGWNACQRIFETRPQDILRVLFSQSRSPHLKKVKDWCREHKLPYRKLDQESLNKVAASVHHEGCVMVVRPLKQPSIYDWMQAGLKKNQFALALDRVENPHNVGAILRSCAYFGAQGLLVGLGETASAISSSAARMAEGALEMVPLLETKSLSSALRDLKAKGMFIVGADPASRQGLYDLKWRWPCVMVVGNEQEGLSDPVKKRCDALVRIPGTGDMQSLNASVAAGVLLAELARRSPPLSKPPSK
ncbi:MAG: 23S rRNA (guanosine(2251)-2'-O)-methyltransferase RlmB [Nitrospinota bacterium]|nr:23S rRNA (guanosine(2251)-2'-O)-methyltransferase RlmB [Nitrospinota bacterium]